jgi:hypothetical protein
VSGVAADRENTALTKARRVGICTESLVRMVGPELVRSGGGGIVLYVEGEEAST